MDAALKAKWVEALRSGKYTQALSNIGSVRRRHLCCLGVGAHVAKPSIELDCTSDAVDELGRHGLPGWTGEGDDARYSDTIRALIAMNDQEFKSFAQIADWIEANL